ncbi:SDR family NAD(P)-dependent oxidoreductase [Streptomyces fuscichromogenes]|uniref:SDR family oxidoreductase n=1 Tax=Streptomyces fuscichromogenes TaxID=1324013 RepID=A0A917X9N0_9ACTN|nr:SDR family oxidoreductase [Streptomyces fuscichromogenes]GGM97778.1 hypothetical protein GCM10011578_018340 [Streptomyces fuscichromogenes]
MRGLRGKSFVVAGDATGTGEDVAKRLAAEGASVTLGDVDFARAEETARRIIESGGRALAIECDFTDRASLEWLVDRTVSRFGGIDGLCNVGVRPSAMVPDNEVSLLDLDPEVWRRALEVYLLGYALTCSTVLPPLLDQGMGAIVNIAPGVAEGGSDGRPASSVHSGVNSLTHHIATRWGEKGVRCNTLTISQARHGTWAEGGRPAQTAIPVHAPAPWPGHPDDPAAAAAFLLSDEAKSRNGEEWYLYEDTNPRG